MVKKTADLFDYSLAQQIQAEAPLADRMRPRTLDEFVGQSHILSPGRLLRRAIQADQLSSLIFFGPPGTGKTTLARIIANTTRAQFLSVNAVLSGIKDIREAIADAQRYRQEHQRRTILFIDEVHRFNKAQQDALLPHVENGTVILIGATTENPYFEVNKALVSRSRIFQLKSLESSDLARIVDQALADPERGYGGLSVTIEDAALGHLVKVANGDARALLNALELAVVTSQPGEDGGIHLDLNTAEESIQQKAVLYDKDGDAHFDTISAFIKSLRGSDPDAALYWMAKMIYGGEDPRFIFRRMIIFAGEDVGMADPAALQVTVSAASAFDYVGMPEGRFHLAQACLYLATAPKSNSAFAFFDALNTVNREREGQVPNHLKDGNRDKEGFGHGQGYLYPHAYSEHWVVQQYLPDVLQGRVFYHPTRQGFEDAIRLKVEQRREAQLAAMLEAAENENADGEALWQGRTLGNAGEILADIRDHLFTLWEPGREDMVLNLNAGNGLILGELLRRVADGDIYALVENEREAETLKGQVQHLQAMRLPVILNTGGRTEKTLAGLVEQGIHFEAVIGRGGLMNPPDPPVLIKRLAELLKPGGWLLAAENIPGWGQRLSGLIDWTRFPADVRQAFIEAETEFWDDPRHPRLRRDADFLVQHLSEAGLHIQYRKSVDFTVNTMISRPKMQSWFQPRGEDPPSLADRLAGRLSTEKLDSIGEHLLRKCGGQWIPWKTSWFFLKAEKGNFRPER